MAKNIVEYSLKNSMIAICDNELKRMDVLSIWKNVQLKYRY